MLRTIAVLLLLLGLATATPVVCLCAPTPIVDAAQPAGTSTAADPPSLVATSAAAVVASLVATAGGVPAAQPWQLPRPVTARLHLPPTTAPGGPVWAPAVPPPR